MGHCASGRASGWPGTGGTAPDPDRERPVRYLTSMQFAAALEGIDLNTVSSDPLAVPTGLQSMAGNQAVKAIAHRWMVADAASRDLPSSSSMFWPGNAEREFVATPMTLLTAGAADGDFASSRLQGRRADLVAR